MSPKSSVKYVVSFKGKYETHFVKSRKLSEKKAKAFASFMKKQRDHPVVRINKVVSKKRSKK